MFTGKFTERKNSGWCGTPPVVYSDYDGIWSEHDSLISVSTGFWGGTVDYQWKIVALDKDYLSLYIVKQEYKHENN